MKKTITNSALMFFSFTISVYGAMVGDDHGHEHEGDIVVGRTGTGQLAVEFDFDTTIGLPPVTGLITGWALDDPGFTTLESDEPKEDFFTIGAGAQVVFELVSVDPALAVWTPGFVHLLETAGQQFMLGGHEFDVHATFLIDPSHPSFNPNVDLYMLSFRLLDTGSTGYAVSDTYNVTFTPVPEPAMVLVLGISSALCLRNARTRPSSEARQCHT